MLIPVFKEYSYALELLSNAVCGMSEAGIGGKPGISINILLRSLKLLSLVLCKVGRYRKMARPLAQEVKK
jgi:hypothetical protein